MYSEIINSLRLSSFPNNKFIIVTKDVASDSNFVFCELLSHYINKNFTVILLNFAQSYAHYNHMLLKSGINTRQLKENEQILTIDGLSEIEKLTNIEADNMNQDTPFRDLFTDSENADSMQRLYYLINETAQKLVNESKQFILFIDDYCRSLCFKNKNVQSILLLGSVYEEEDMLNKRQNDYLLHVADIKIQVEGLKTGYSKDVHGKITLTVRNSADCTMDCQKLLYKVTDGGARLFTLDV